MQESQAVPHSFCQIRGMWLGSLKVILSDDNKAIDMSTIDVLYLFTALNTSKDCSQEDTLERRLDAQ